jgi:hypothetical protein
MNMAIFWDIDPCSLYSNRHFRRAYRLHLQGRKSAEQEFILPSHLLARCFLARLIFDPEDGGDNVFRNTGLHTDCTALYPSRRQHLFLAFP